MALASSNDPTSKFRNFPSSEFTKFNNLSVSISLFASFLHKLMINN